MRLKRLRLANFKDVVSREIEFPPSGVIVIQGPNEVGKTALQEALDLLLEVHADSNKTRVKIQRPADQDAAPEVELEADSGPYSFTYFKRFDTRRPETLLRIRRPHPEQLTGREAHERVESILSESLDLDLWKAVRVQQGAAIGQVALADSRSLMAALDAAAGTAPAGQGELTLFGRIEREALRYFTPTGQPGQELVKDRREMTKLEEQVDEFTAELGKLQKTIDQLQWLEGQLRELDDQVAEAKRNRTQREAEVRELEKLEAELARLRANAEAAAAKAEQARDRHQAREQLSARLQSMDKAVQVLEQTHMKLRSSLDVAAAEQAHQAHEAEAAAVRREQAEQIYELRRQDYDFRQDELGLVQLRERRERVVDSREKVIRARELIERIKITESGLKRIDDHRLTLERARAALAAGSPNLRFEAEAELGLQVDGEVVPLAQGQVLERTVADRLDLHLPSLFRLSVRSGTSVEALTQQVRNAEAQLARLFKSYGVVDREEADRQLKSRVEAERTVHEAEARQRQDLRDLTLEEMAAKIDDLQRRTAAYCTARSPQPEMGTTIELCEELRGTAESDASSTKAAHEGLLHGSKIADDRVQDLRLKAQEASAQLNLQTDNRAELVHELAQARASAADEDLARELLAATGEERETKELYVAEQGKLATLEPERLRTRAEIAATTYDGLNGQRSGRIEERLRLEAELEVRGQEGLAESQDEAISKRDRGRRDLELLERRASAAKHLLAVMRACREEARQRREGPLRDRITELGRILYGSSFSIELDERLAVSRRTLNNITLDFEQLSTGAQEQLTLIARLSAGMLVAGTGEVPIILDDTLGHTDEDRLEYMCHILSLAGRQCQVIVLTSYPRRYASVSGATVISLVGDTVARLSGGSMAPPPEVS